MTLAVEVYDGTNPWAPAALLGTLSEDDARSFRIAENDPGTWSVRVPRGSTDAGLIQTNRWVKFRLNGAVKRSGRIGPWEQGTVQQGEESAELRTVSGPGCLATLRDAIVFPHSATGRLARDARWFNFASPDYPDEASWAAAVQLYRQGDPATSLPGVDVPENWPDPSAYWIWGTNYNLAASPPQAVGDCYFRTSVTLAAEGDYALFITADDGYELWIDGIMLAAQTEAFIWRQTYRIDQFLDAGTHNIAIKATNMNRPSSPATNHAGLLFAMYSTTSGGELSVLQVHSDNTWKCKPYPATPPGFTPGEILDLLLTEAYDRNTIQVWGWSFTGALDSNGDAWPAEIEMSFRHEDTMLDVLHKLAETHVEFAADEDVMDLDVVAKDGWTVASGVTLAEGTHLGSLTHANDPSRVTDLLGRSSEGRLVEISSGVASPTDPENPRIEQFLSGGTAPSDESLETLAEGVFNSTGAYLVRVTAGVEEVTGAVPLTDFDVFQTVQVEDESGVLATTRVRAITVTDVSVSEDGELEGSVVYAVEATQS